MRSKPCIEIVGLDEIPALPNVAIWSAGTLGAGMKSQPYQLNSQR
jgi:hypothetical protein